MNALEQHVSDWVYERSESYDNGVRGVAHDLAYGGCESGIVNHLIYYEQTTAFYIEHKKEINKLLEVDEDCLQDKFVRNTLAWKAFEKTAKQLFGGRE